MIEFPYLVALALIEQDGKRALPLGGQALKSPLQSDQTPGPIGEKLVKDLLIRVFQRSEESPLRRAAGDHSLLLIQVSMELMQDKIPLLKEKWIQSGNKEEFLSALSDICDGIWCLKFERYKGSEFFRI